jgi:hypothetical protein
MAPPLAANEGKVTLRYKHVNILPAEIAAYAPPAAPNRFVYAASSACWSPYLS